MKKCLLMILIVTASAPAAFSQTVKPKLEEAKMSMQRLENAARADVKLINLKLIHLPVILGIRKELDQLRINN